MTTIAPTPSGLDVRQFALHVVKPTLAALSGPDTPNLDSEAAIELVLGTAAQESGFRFLDQVTGPDDRTLGPAHGLHQIEPDTLYDLHANYLRYRPSLAGRLRTFAADAPSSAMQLVTNLAYATAVCRVIYYRSPMKLARAGDIAGHAAVWKRVYNTEQGKGRVEEFIDNYRRRVAPFL